MSEHENIVAEEAIVEETPVVVEEIAPVVEESIPVEGVDVE